MDDINSNYDRFYRSRNPNFVYPVEFVVRGFLGNYPRLKNAPDAYKGGRLLDLGFGDGRNMPLFANLGMEIHGVEITSEICASTQARMKCLGVETDLRVGRNNSIPYEDAFFHQVVACHACYYVDTGSSFDENLNEIARILRPGGRFLFSAPKASSYIMKGARDLGDGHMEIAQDPYGVRNGQILKKFDNEQEIEKKLGATFGDFAIGQCQNDFWGIEEHVWTVVCWRRA